MIVGLMFAALQLGNAQIVVTGKRLDEAYLECAARRCSPLRDAQVTIAWAEKQFRDGAYLEAKRTLSQAVTRNKGFARSDPKPVAALYEAYATVALQEGDTAIYRRAVSGQVQTLRDNLPPSDPAVADAAFALGDMWMKLGNAADADAAYKSAERQARERGQTNVYLSAALRRVWLASAQGDVDHAGRMLDAFAEDPLAQDPSIQGMLPALRLRLAVKRSDDAAIDRLVTTITRNDAGSPPVLVWAPPYEPTAEAVADENALKFGEPNRAGAASSDLGAVQWADMGFWIRPDGRTDDVQTLRGSPSRDWTVPVKAQIGGRRYAPLANSATPQGMYRIERVTLRAAYMVPVGSLIRRRAGTRRLEILDLTAGSRPPPAASAN